MSVDRLWVTLHGHVPHPLSRLILYAANVQQRMEDSGETETHRCIFRSQRPL